MGRRLARAAVALYAASVVFTAVFVYVVSKTDPEANLVGVWLVFITLPTSFVVLGTDLPNAEAFILLLTAIGLLQAAGLALLLKTVGTPRDRR